MNETLVEEGEMMAYSHQDAIFQQCDFYTQPPLNLVSKVCILDQLHQGFLEHGQMDVQHWRHIYLEYNVSHEWRLTNPILGNVIKIIHENYIA